jgi:hypothetical protein
MTFPVLVVPHEGQYSAVLAGAPEIRALGATRDEAVTALRTEIAQRLKRGELYWLELDAPGIASLAGRYADDPTLRGICEEAYR